jgi:hypothetical protein
MSQVTAATYLTPLEGEILRAQLGFAGIPANLSNVELVTWFWHLSNAVGGVALHVAADDAAAAEEVLSSGEDDASAAATPERPCGACGELLPHDWHVCWRCGTTADGAHDPDFLGGTAASAIWHYLHGLDAPGALVLLLALLVFVFPPGLLLIGLWIVIGSISPAGEYESDVSALEVVDPGAESDVRDALTDRGDDLCARALRSALLGVGWLPPLIVLSIWTLLSIGYEGIPVSARGRRWYCAAWCLNVTYVLLFAGLCSAGTWLFVPASPEVLREVLTGVP